MGVAPNKTFTFDGVSSSTYGVYITGEGVFNAPERSVEMISIPGRDGEYALDQGRFENITVTYKVGMFDVDESNFATKVSDFRNWLCSKVGYVRLTDTYNANEYRMAVYKSGLELKHDMLIAGEAEITFDCKPQRFLTSGETAVSVANNGTIANPTLFESKPTIEFNGYGNIGIGGQSITVTNDPIGNILLSNTARFYLDYVQKISSPNPQKEVAKIVFDASLLNNGDSIYFGEVVVVDTRMSTIPSETITNVSTTIVSVDNGVSVSARTQNNAGEYTVLFDPQTLTKGTSASLNIDYSFETTYKSGGGFVGIIGRTKLTLNYDGDSTITLLSNACIEVAEDERASGVITMGIVNGVSTKTIPSKITVDLDIGEATWSNSGTPASANNNVQLGAKLPTLAPGNNTITYSNTITNFKVTPHWWKV